MSTVNLYDVLNVSSDCTRKELKDAYRELVKKLHPDRPTGNAELFELVTHAFNVLSNSATRAEYDQLTELTKQSDSDFFKMRSGCSDFMKTQPTDKPSKKAAKKDFRMTFEGMDKKHGYKRTLEDSKLSLDDVQTKIKDIEITREQEDIENEVPEEERLFDRSEPFDLDKFNAAFDAMHGGMGIIEHSGNPDAWNGMGTCMDSSFGTIENYGDIYIDGNVGAFAPADFTQGIKQTKITRDDFKKIKPAEYTRGHNVKEEDYNTLMERKLKERELHTRGYDEMTYADYKNDLGGYGIFESLGINDISTLSWDNDEEDIQKKYQRLLELRNKEKL